MIVVLIIGILLAIAVPNFINARTTSRQQTVLGNLKQVDTAMEQWAMDKGKKAGDAVVVVGQNNLSEGVKVNVAR